MEKKINGMEQGEPDLVTIMKIVAQSIMVTLATWYPDVAKTNHKRILEAAQAAAMDLQQYGKIRDLVSDPQGRRKLGLELLRAGIINPKPESLFIVGAPARVEQCATPQEVFTLLTLLALLYDDALRALLYFHGYRINWKLYDLPKVESKVVQ